MSITYSNFTNGTVMVAADMVAEFQRGINWLNRGIAAGDVGDGTVRIEHLWQPETHGWPRYKTEFIHEDVKYLRASMNAGVWQMQGFAPPSDAAHIFTGMMPASGRFNVPWMGVRVQIPFDAYISATWEWKVFQKYDWKNAASPTYGASNNVGTFTVWYRTLPTGNLTADVTSTRQVAPANRLAAAGARDSDTTGTGTMSTALWRAFNAGTYDIFLAYSHDNHDVQLSVHQRNMVVEVIPQ